MAQYIDSVFLYESFYALMSMLLAYQVSKEISSSISRM